MKRKAVNLCMLSCLSVLVTATGCSTRAGSYEDSITSQAYRPSAPTTDECAALNEEIEYAASLSNRMKNSRYAVYYQAMSRERVLKLQKQADAIGCEYPQIP